MKKIITNTFMTLDGVMQAPGGPEEDKSGNFEFGGWQFNFSDDAIMSELGQILNAEYDLLLGRKTYEIFAAFWPFKKDDPIANQFNKAKKYVATTTLKSATWANTSLLSNFVDEIKAIKATDGLDLHVWGSANMIQTLMKNNLIDEMNIMIHPLVLGKGKKLFQSGVMPLNMAMKKNKVGSSGIILATYAPAGKFSVKGSYTGDEPSDLEIKRRKKVEVEG